MSSNNNTCRETEGNEMRKDCPNCGYLLQSNSVGEWCPSCGWPSHAINKGDMEKTAQLEADLKDSKAEVERLNKIVSDPYSYWHKVDSLTTRAEAAEAESLWQAKIIGRIGDQLDDVNGKLGRVEAERDNLKAMLGDLGITEEE